MESSGDDADLPAIVVQRIDEGKRAVREMDGMVDIVEHRNRQILQQCDAGTQRIAEIQFAVHRTGGDGCDSITDAGGDAELVDGLFVNQRGIHIHYQQSGVGQRGHGGGIQRFFFKHGFDCRKALGQWVFWTVNRRKRGSAWNGRMRGCGPSARPMTG